MYRTIQQGSLMYTFPGVHGWTPIIGAVGTPEVTVVAHGGHGVQHTETDTHVCFLHRAARNEKTKHTQGKAPRPRWFPVQTHTHTQNAGGDIHIRRCDKKLKESSSCVRLHYATGPRSGFGGCPEPYFRRSMKVPAQTAERPCAWP